MNRKYPALFFLLGFVQNMIRYFLLAAAAVILIIIGAVCKNICLYIGLGVLAVYLLVCFIEQLVIRRTALKKSGNPAYDEIMDAILGGGSREEIDRAIDKHAVLIEPSGDNQQHNERTHNEE